ncbi:hypothetical protein CHU00_15365 [Sphingobacterium cellulitidis]|nr:hypothetical protein CHT99_19140 [Sphingobacterium cellulitidis]OYD44751.1 hypothetical protein CHU00_15365 [Sphingobacterium cellulitidis]
MSRRPSEFFGIEAHEFLKLKSLLYLSSKAQTVLTTDFENKFIAPKATNNQPFPLFQVIPVEFWYFQCG